MRKLVVSLSGAFAAVVAWGFPSAVTYVTDDQTVEFAASTAESSKVSDSGTDNKYGSFVYANLSDARAGTLKVTVPAGADKAIMWSALFVTNGVLTLDLTDVAAAHIPYYQRGGIITRYPDATGKMCEGKLVVKGMSELVCGLSDSSQNLRFEAPQVSFADADGNAIEGTVKLSQRVVLLAPPTTCAWTLDGVTQLSVGNERAIDSLIDEDILTVSGYELRLIGKDDCIDPAATIRAVDGGSIQTYYADFADSSKFKTKPDSDSASANGFFWGLNGHSTTEQTVANAIELAKGTTLNLNLRTTTFKKAISGQGKITITAPGSATGCRATFEGAVNIEKLSVAPRITNNAVFNTTFCDAFSGAVTVSTTNSVVTFAPTDGASRTAVISRLTGYTGTALPAGKEGAYPAIAAQQGAQVTIDPAGMEGCVRLIVGGGTIDFGGTVISSTSGGSVFVQDGEIVSVPDGSRLAVGAGGSADFGDVALSTLKVDGTAQFGFALPVEPALWFDGSAEASVSNLWLDATIEAGSAGDTIWSPNSFPVTKDGGYHLIERWNDRRPDRTANYAQNIRHFSNNQHKYYNYVYPLAITNGLNDKTYISMADGTRRMSFKSNLTTKFLVMVFGSQDGGGNAIVTQASLGRGGEPDVGGTNMEASAPVMTNENFKTGHVWLDGEGIDPTTTGFDGGWQIVSVKLAADANSNKGLAVKGLGAWANESKDSGGQNYAEVLLFDQVLTDDQRRTVESYLARKWGLVGKYKGVLAADRHINAYGAGDIRLNGVAAQLGGVFSGTVTVGPDAELMMPDELKPAPTEEDVAKVGGRLGWYDPSQNGAIDYQKSSDYKSCVNVLRDRVNGRDDGTYVLVAGNGRSPSVEERTTEFGVTQRWLQFANVNPTSTNKYEGNALRMNLMPTLATGTDAPLSGVRTVMMVMDSSQGGGCPVLEGGIGGGVLARFGNSDMFCKDWSRPIWTTKAVNNYWYCRKVGDGIPV